MAYANEALYLLQANGETIQVEEQVICKIPYFRTALSYGDIIPGRPYGVANVDSHVLRDVIRYVRKDSVDVLHVREPPFTPSSNRISDHSEPHQYIEVYIIAHNFGLEQIQNDIVSLLTTYYLRNIVQPKAIGLLSKNALRDSRLYSLLIEEVARGMQAGFYNERAPASSAVLPNIKSAYAQQMSYWSLGDYEILLGYIGASSQKKKSSLIAAARSNPCSAHIHDTTPPCRTVKRVTDGEDTTPTKPRSPATPNEVNDRSSTIAASRSTSPVKRRRIQIEVDELCKTPTPIRYRSPTIEADSDINVGGTLERSLTPAVSSKTTSRSDEPDHDSYPLSEDELTFDDFLDAQQGRLMAARNERNYTNPMTEGLTPAQSFKEKLNTVRTDQLPGHRTAARAIAIVNHSLVPSEVSSFDGDPNEKTTSITNIDDFATLYNDSTRSNTSSSSPGSVGASTSSPEYRAIREIPSSVASTQSFKTSMELDIDDLDSSQEDVYPKSKYPPKSISSTNNLLKSLSRPMSPGRRNLAKKVFSGEDDMTW